MVADLLLRSPFFVPGHVEKYLEKARTLSADALILDIEDSVPIAEKPVARQRIKRFLDSGAYALQQVIVRINELDAGMLLDDLECACHPNTMALMPAKARNAADIECLDRLLSQYESRLGLVHGHFRLLPLIETLEAVDNVMVIAKHSSRLIGLAFGGEDYLRELGGVHGVDDHTFAYPRTRIAIAAKAAGIQAIDTPYLDVRDIPGFIDREQNSRDLGYEGCLLIHPSQIELAHKCFSPAADEVAQAQSIARSIYESRDKGLNVVLLDGVLVGPPMQKSAEQTLRKYELIQKRKAFLQAPDMPAAQYLSPEHTARPKEEPILQ